MEFDIRNNSSEAITSIRVAPESTQYQVADTIKRSDICDGRIRIVDSDSDFSLVVMNKEHAENIISGLQKAIQLGWI